MKAIPLFLRILSLVFFLFSDTCSAGQILKVATFNFNSETVLEDTCKSKIRDIRFPSITEWIQQNDPDIIFISEGWNHHSFPSVIEEIALKVGYDFYFYTGMGVSPVYLDSDGIIVKKKFHFAQRNTLALPHSSFVAGNGVNKVLAFGSASWAVGGVLTLDDGTHLYSYSTHLIGKSESDRTDQAKAIHESIENQIRDNGEDSNTVRAIIAGDFNSTPESDSVRSLLALGYRDSFGEAHPDSPDSCTSCSDPTSLSFNPITIGPGLFPRQDTLSGNLRLDYIFTRGSEFQTLASTRIFTKPLNGMWMSDHYGVLTSIAVGLEDNLPEHYPNPEGDQLGGGELSSLIHIDDTNRDFPEQVVSAERGITFFNDTSHKVKVKITGDGAIWLKNSVVLKPGRVAAFFFEPGKSYRFKVHHWLSKNKWVGKFTTRPL